MGCNNTGYYSDELWVFSTTSKEWTLLSTTTGGEGPSGRGGHAMTAVTVVTSISSGSDIYLHGGATDTGEPRDRVRRGGWLYV